MTPIRMVLVGFAFIATMVAADASAAVVDITFTGKLTDPIGTLPWGHDPFGSVVGDPFVAKFQFDTAKGTTTTSGSEYILDNTGIATGSISYGGKTFVPTGSTAAKYLRSTTGILLIFYDDPLANTGIVPEAATLTTTWSNGLADPLNYTLTPAEIAVSSGGDVALPGYGGALYAGLAVETITVAAPEPSGLATLTLGLMGLALGVGVRRRR